jgi:hypothetical protein
MILNNGRGQGDDESHFKSSHEGPGKFRADCHQYFANTTRACVWIGFKVCYWKEEVLGGLGGQIGKREPCHDSN